MEIADNNSSNHFYVHVYLNCNLFVQAQHFIKELGLSTKRDIYPLFQWTEKKIVVALKSSVTDLLISFLTLSVPLGSFPPHIPGPLTVNCFIKVLFILYCCMQIAKVGHTEGHCYESKCHHRFVLTKKKKKSTFLVKTLFIHHKCYILQSQLRKRTVNYSDICKKTSLPSCRLIQITLISSKKGDLIFW